MHSDKDNEYFGVSDGYKIAVIKTIYTHLKLVGRKEETDFKLPIFNAATDQLDSVFEYTLTENDLENL